MVFDSWFDWEKSSQFLYIPQIYYMAYIQQTAFPNKEHLPRRDVQYLNIQACHEWQSEDDANKQ